MIRRWSCVININNNFNETNLFKKNLRINLFKTSVNLKRFSYNYTKFKRKALIRIKHKNNFLIYTNIIKKWVKHYSFNKNYLKFQFFNQIFLNNYFFFNLSFIKTKNDEIKNNFNFIFANLINKNFNYFFISSNNKFFKHLPLTLAYSDSAIIKTNSTLPAFGFYDNICYSNNINLSQINNISNIFEIFFDINLKKIVEIQKILTIFFFYNISKSLFINVK